MLWYNLLIISLSTSAFGDSVIDHANEAIITEALEGRDTDFTVLSVCNIDGVVKLASLETCQKTVAVGRYKNTVNLTGWAQLEIETFKEYSPELQAYAAGVLEGTLSRTLIGYYIQNMGPDTCVGSNISCPKIKDYLKKNTAYIKQHINEGSSYWQSVKRTYFQVTGVLHGYEGNQNFDDPQIDFSLHDIFMIQLINDFYDFNMVYEDMIKQAGSNLRCSALIKLTNDDLLTAHSAFFSLQSMLRVLKLYKFGLDIPGHTQSFSSYPGIVFSSDDFYTLSSGIVVTETTNVIYNNSLYKKVKPENQIMYWLRMTAANQLASSGAEWVQIFAKYNSGSCNNQWMIVDYNNYNPAEEFPDSGVLYILEQIPGYIHSADLTSVLKETGYWASYNIPYFPDISNITGNTAMGEEFYFYNYNATPRARIFARDHHKVVDMDSLRQLMRYNDYTHDPLSRCNCTPPYTAEAAISSRGDLNAVNGTYPVPQMSHRNHAALDYKGTNYEMAKNLTFNAIMGPPYENVPAFCWSISAFKDIKHVGIPDFVKFSEINTKWQTSTKKSHQ